MTTGVYMEELSIEALTRSNGLQSMGFLMLRKAAIGRLRTSIAR
jgi:hypothetical protein